MSDESWRDERLDCPCGHPLHPADGPFDPYVGGAYWLRTTAPITCPKCCKSSVVRLTEFEHAWAGYTHQHDCRCDPAGEELCPTAWPLCLVCDQQVDPASEGAPFCDSGCGPDDLPDGGRDD